MPLDRLLRPRSIAIVGASERPSVGRTLVEALDGIGFRGDVYPVNPRYESLLGRALLSLGGRPSARRRRAGVLRESRPGARTHAARGGSRRRRGRDLRRRVRGSGRRGPRAAGCDRGDLPRGVDRPVRAELHGRDQPARAEPRVHPGAARSDSARRQRRADLAERIDLHRSTDGLPALRLEPGDLVRQRGGRGGRRLPRVPHRRPGDTRDRDVPRNGARAGAVRGRAGSRGGSRQARRRPQGRA